MLLLQKVVIPGLTRNLGSCESVEFTGFRIRSGMTELKKQTFCNSIIIMQHTIEIQCLAK